MRFIAARRLFACFVLVCIATVAPLAHSADATVHPLDPLSAKEIERAVEIIRSTQKLPADALFPMLALHEPTKAELSTFKPDSPPARKAAATVMDRNANRSYDAVIDLTAGKVSVWKEVPGVHPLVLSDEYETVSKIVRADARWQAAIRKRGIAELDKVYLDAWAPGYVTVPGAEGARLMRVLSFYKGDGTNAYGRPIEGVVAVVNLNAGKVMQVVDTGVVPVSEGRGTDFFDATTISARPALKPLTISQPQGPDFEIRGHEIRWQKWRFRYSLHPREGLVLHSVGFEEGDRVRSILRRASVAEMVVPYGDASQNWNWRSAFDQGEYGLGRTANSLQLGLDVPENAVLLDTVFCHDDGKPYVQEKSVAVYEQDGGILWKHTDEDSGDVAIRRARQLVVGYVTTIGNYDYGLNWIFNQDGSLEVRADLTGILLVKGVPSQICEKCRLAAEGKGGVEPQGDQRYGTLVDKNSVASNHQHIFSFRLDFDIDGDIGGGGNSAIESNIRPAAAGPDNPANNAFIHVETPLLTEKDARRNLSLVDHRRWKVFNPSSRNALGHYAGYMLEPGDNSVAYVGAQSSVRKRAGYVNQHVWITQHKPGEDHAAGDYPRQRAAGEGLPQWSGDESLVNQDLVLWYTLGITHVPRAEEWPVMPAAHAGFKLVPSGFFVRNPALDVP